MKRPLISAYSCIFLAVILLNMTGCKQAKIIVPKSHYVREAKKSKIVIFVHGILGDMDNTWVNPTTGTSWPELLCTDPAFDDFDVFVYGYASPTVGHASDITQIATRFGQELKDDGFFSKYKEVDFVTHSMGGLITKRMLETLNTPTDIGSLELVHSVLYIAVPANGANVASVASWVSANPQFKSMSSDEANNFLQSVETDWVSLTGARTLERPFPRSFAAFETIPTHGLKVVPALYISQVSDLPAVGFDYDHSGIVKPDGKDSDIYKWVRARILESSALSLPKSPQNGRQTPTPPANEPLTRPPVRSPSYLRSGHIILKNGLIDADHSGIEFDTGSISSWFSAKADLLVTNSPNSQDPASFFVQHNAGAVYTNAPQDLDANGGIQLMPQHSMNEISECPRSSLGYSSHFFKPAQAALYCVMTRDGKHFAKVQVTELESDRIGFDYVYQPVLTSMF